MPVTSFIAGTAIKSADVNSNFGLCVLTDTARTITVTHTWSASQTFSGGWTAGAACTVSTGGLTVTAGGVTVSAGGIAVTGNSTITGTLGGLTGLTVASGGAAVTGNSTVTGTFHVTSTSALDGAVTCGAGISATTGTFSGTLAAAQTTVSVANAKSNIGAWHIVVTDLTTMAAGVGGGITFEGYKTGTSAFGLFGAIAGYKVNGTAADENGGVKIYYSNAGTITTGITLDNTGATTFAAGISATTGAFSGDFAVNTSKFTVAAASGNTVVAGTLSTTGLASFNGGFSGTTGSLNSDLAVSGKITATGNVIANSGLLIGNTATAPSTTTGQLSFGSATQTTVGAAGGASALPATPVRYITISFSGSTYVIPVYNP